METKTQHGYLVLADISGFTSYLAGVELDHAHGVLSDLLELIVAQFKPLLTLSKLEGDAVFAYALESQMPRGETLLELLEATYVAFRGRVEAIHRRTTCECNACRAIPTLDLKFMAHHGNFVLQSVAGATELLGSDVNLAHRLLKNHVNEATGWRAYALYSAACLEHMCVWPEGAHVQTETYEHLGAVETHSLDLHARYKELREARRVFLTADEADAVLTLDFPAPPSVVWTWANDPQRRGQWMEGTTWRAGLRPGGRTSSGARNHCAHGKGESLENILDWRPFEYFTVEHTDPKSPMKFTFTYQLTLTPDGAGTRLQAHILLQRPPWPRWVTRLLCKLFVRLMGIEKSLHALRRLVAQDVSYQATSGLLPILATG